MLNKYQNSISYRRIQSKLALLYPGKEKEILIKNYCARKIKLEAMTAIIFVIFIVAAVISGKTNSIISDDGKIERPSQTKNVEHTLIARVEDEEIPIDIKVAQKEYTSEELQSSYKEACIELENVILGNNVSLDHISDDLFLPVRLEGYPFSFQWVSSSYELINDRGEIQEDEISELGERVDLICHFYYKDYEFEKKYELSVYPKEMTSEERTKKEIIASILTKQNETQYKKYLQLPQSIGKKEISWKESPSYTALVMAMLACIAVVGIWWGVDNDLTKKCEERDRLLRLDYSEFVSKLQLLVSSGMTIRGALERMEADYRLSRKEKYVYEELSICMKRLRDGASEISVYQLFGNRCGLLCYKKLAVLLIQNINKGTDDLVDALSYEAKAAFEERKHIARRMGDEAQVKLLFPMMLMLCIVMVIILVPAYFSFSS